MQNEEQRQAWLTERLKYVGASEISTVIKSECTEEEIREAMGGSTDEFLKDKLFTSPYCLYHYKKELATPPPFSEVLNEYGHEMEKYAVDHLKYKFFEKLDTKNQPQELIYCKDLHKLCAYTPDALIEFKDDFNFYEIDVKKGDKAIFEIKTSNLFKFHQDNWGVPEGQEEARFQYIIQAQYQLWIQNKIDPKFKWAVVVCILPKEKDFDNDFGKGKAVAWCKGLNFANLEIKEVFAKKLEENFSVYYWIYPIFKSLHPLFKKSLDRWQKRLENNVPPKSDLENTKENKLQKKQILEKMEEFKVSCQERFGIENQGIIVFDEALKEKYPNLFDKISINKKDREDKSQANKSIQEFDTKIIDFCIREKCFGFSIDESTVHLAKGKNGSGEYIKVINNFKTSQENLEGIVKVKDFDNDLTKNRFV
jgi:hypothetical protein